MSKQQTSSSSPSMSPPRAREVRGPVSEGARIEREIVALRTRLLQDLTHQARSPLAAVRGYTRLTLDGRAGPLNDAQRQYLGKAVSNVQRLIELMNVVTGVLGYAVRSDSPPWGTGASELLAEAVHAFRDKARSMDLRLVTSLRARPHVVVGDQTQLLQVFVTLLQVLTGPVSASPGTVGIGRSLRLETRSRNGFVDVTFSSSEPGLVRDLCARLDADVDDPADEVGSRMLWAQDIARLHGGELLVTHSPAHRSGVLVLSLPVVEVEPEPAEVQ